MIKIAKKMEKEQKREVEEKISSQEQKEEKKTNETKSDDGKTMAIISYITWVGLLIAFIMNNEKKNEFAKFHIRQSLLLTLAGFVGMFIFWIPLVGWVLALGLFVLWVLGLISAINGEKKELPLVGKLAQDWFKGL